MNGGQLAAGLILAFGGGYIIRSWRCLSFCQDVQVRLTRKLIQTEANQDHRHCRATHDAMASYIAEQKRLIDLLRSHPGDVVSDAERFLREGGGS